MSSTEYNLTYFNGRGLAEASRWILSHGGANWKDNRISAAGPGTPVPDDIKSRCRFGQVPLLEFEGKRLVQSTAISRYLAKKFNLAGKDDFEAALADEVVDAVRDIFLPYFPAFRESDADKKAGIIKEATNGAKTKFLPALEKAALENGGYFVGGNLTWADIVFTVFIYQIGKIFSEDLLTDFPTLTALSEKTSNAPGIKEWIAKRPDTQF